MAPDNIIAGSRHAKKTSPKIPHPSTNQTQRLTAQAALPAQSSPKNEERDTDRGETDGVEAKHPQKVLQKLTFPLSRRTPPSKHGAEIETVVAGDTGGQMQQRK